MEMAKAAVMCVGMICIASIEVMALVQGLDGTLLAAAVGAIASIATGTVIKLSNRNEVENDSGSPSRLPDSG
jgi:hypothetical protein